MSGGAVVSLEDALARLDVRPDYDAGGGEGPGPHVHTFRRGGPIVFGAHRRLADIRAAIARHGVAEAGPHARRMGHGLVLFDEQGALFLATRDATVEPSEPPLACESALEEDAP